MRRTLDNYVQTLKCFTCNLTFTCNLFYLFAFPCEIIFSLTLIFLSNLVRIYSKKFSVTRKGNGSGWGGTAILLENQSKLQ